MRKLLIGVALLAIGATAQAETYHVNGVTIHVPTNCSSTSCVSVNAPEYGYHREGRRAKARKENKDRKDVKTATAPGKKDESTIPMSSPPAPAAAAPAAAAPAAADTAPAKSADVPAAPPTDTPAK